MVAKKEMDFDGLMKISSCKCLGFIMIEVAYFRALAIKYWTSNSLFHFNLFYKSNPI